MVGAGGGSTCSASPLAAETSEARRRSDFAIMVVEENKYPV
jgi:hypothetical protein